MRVGELSIDLMANISRLQKDMNSAVGTVNRSMGAIEKSVESAKRALGNLGVGLGLGTIASQAIKLTDAYSKFTAQLRLATRSQQEYAVAMGDVRRISQVAQADLSATAVLYARIANGTRELGLGQAAVAKITEATNLALKVSGATAEESASAMLQLSQAFASGVLRGEEFNAVNESAPRLMLALADGIGVPVSALRAMAEEGRITSEIMAGALPKALADLREEARNVETIGGSFTLLKNAVLELVGAQAQASGFVRAFTSGIGALASNLDVLAGVISTVTVAKMAVWLKEVTVETYDNISATRARMAATVAAAQADVSATAASSAQAVATQAMIVVAREEAAAKLAGANASILSAKASLQAAESAGALSFALRSQRSATAELAAAEAARTASIATLATLGRQQASVSAQITAATLAQTAAQKALAGATAATSMTARAASSVLGFLGGPIGAITTLLGLGATAWMVWNSRAEEVEAGAAAAVRTSTRDIIADLDSQIAKLKERNALAGSGLTGIAQSNSAQAQRIAELRALMDQVQSGAGQYGALPAIARQDLLAKVGIELGNLYAKTEQLREETEKLDAAGKQTKLQEWMTKLASKTEKMNAELEKARQELGSAFTPEIEKRIRAQYEERAKGTKKLADEEKTAVKMAKEFAKERQSNLEAAYSEISAIQDQAQAMEDQVATYGMTKTAIDALTISRLEEQRAVLQGFAGSEEAVKLLDQEIEARKRLMSATAQHEALDANSKAAKQAADEWQRSTEQIGQSLTDALLRGFESGKSFSENFAATVRNMFKTMILQPIIQPIMTGVAGSLMGGGPGSPGQSGGGIMGALGQAQQTYSAFTGGVSGSIASGLSSLGETVGSEMLSNFAAGMKGASLAPGLAGPTTAGASGATGAGSWAAGNMGSIMGYGAALYSLTQGNYGSAVGTAIGTAILPGIGTAVGSVLGGLVDGMFDGPPKTRHSQRTTAQYSNGAFDITERDDRLAAGAEVAAAAFAQTSVTAANELFKKMGVDAAIDSFYAIMESSVLGDRNGVASGGALRAGGQSVNFGIPQASDMTISGVGGWSDADMLPRLQADIQLSILEAFKSQAGALPKILGDMLTGVDIRSLGTEEATALVNSFQAIITEVDALSQAFDQLPFENLKNLSFDATASLLQFGGGLEAFTGNLSSYYENFYTESERTAKVVEQLTGQLGDLGFAMPETRDGFRALVEAQDVTTEAGQRTYAALMSISGVFASVTLSAEQLAQKQTELARAQEAAAQASQQAAQAARQAEIDALMAARTLAEQAGSDALAALTASVNARKTELQTAFDAIAESLNTSISASRTAVSALESMANRLRSTLDTMRGQTDDRQSREWAQAQITRARAAGVAPSGVDFERALQIVAQPSEGLFATFEDYQTDFLKTANDIFALSELTGDQLTIEQRTLNSLEDQLKQAREHFEREIGVLDQTLETARQQLDAALGIKDILMTIPDALAAIAAAIAGISAAGAGGYFAANPDVAGAYAGGAFGNMSPEEAAAYHYSAHGAGEGRDTGGLGLTKEQEYIAANPDIAAEFVANPDANGMGLAEYAKWHYENYGKYEGRSFAVGTNYVPFDMKANIHEGERIIPAADNRELMRRLSSPNENSAALLNELKRVNARLERLEAVGVSTAQHTNKTAKALERAMPGGDAIQVREAVTA